jgi:transposase InsO family protein
VLIGRIGAIHAASKGTYGAPRIHAELRATGRAVGKKRVARLMRHTDLAGVSRRRFVTTTVRNGDQRAPDLVDRDFTAEDPNLLWVRGEGALRHRIVVGVASHVLKSLLTSTSRSMRCGTARRAAEPIYD